MSAGASNSVHQLKQMKVRERPAPALRPLTGWNYSSSGVAELHKELTLPSSSCHNTSSLGYFQLWFWCLLLDENGWVMKASMRCAVGLAPLKEGQQPRGTRKQLGHAIISRHLKWSMLSVLERVTLLSVLNGGFWSLLPNIICSVSVY